MGIMRKSTPWEWDGTVVLVSDPHDGSPITDAFDRRIDRPHPETIDILSQALRGCCSELLTFQDLRRFSSEAPKLENALVFPYWFGANSRGRHGLVPAICEANGLKYVGADSFAKNVCNDKELSKAVCRQAGLSVPAAAVIHSAVQAAQAILPEPPVFVKPNYEGTSLGISEGNRCESSAAARVLATQLLELLEQPVIVEEFVEGAEVSACMIGQQEGDIEIKCGQWTTDGANSFDQEKVYSWEYKVLPSGISFATLPSSFLASFHDQFRQCFRSLGKVELLRIDGRVTPEGDFIVLELTPDIYFGPDGEFCLAFGAERDYGSVISRIIGNSIEGYGAKMPMT